MHPLYKDGEKTAFSDFGLGVGIPGTPLSVSGKQRSERLPGMNRWTSRGTIERAFDGVDDGLDDQAMQDLEADQGSVASPLLGAGLAAALAHFGLKAPPNTTGLAALAGAGAGHAYHSATEGNRRKDMGEAAKGARMERGRFPIRGQSRTTSSENTPLVIQGGGAE